MRKIILPALVLTIILIVTYGAVVTLSESREYGKFSLDYYLLTPKDLSDLSKHCESKSRFVYNSADGPKPSIVHLYCPIEDKIISSHIEKNNFQRVSDNQFKKEAIEIEFKRNNTGKVSLITIYEYL